MARHLDDLPKFWHWPHAEDLCKGTANYHGHRVPCCLSTDHLWPHAPCIPGVDFDPAMWAEYLANREAAVLHG